MQLPPVATNLERIGRFAFLGRLGGGPRLKLIFPTGEEASRLPYSRDLRRRLTRLSAHRPPFPAEVYAGPCLRDGVRVWTYAHAFVAGEDMGTIVRRYGGRPPSRLADELGRATGRSLAGLRRATADLVGSPGAEARFPEPEQGTWGERLRRLHDHVMSHTRRAPSRPDLLSTDQSRRLHAVIRALSDRGLPDSVVLPFLAEPPSGLVHSDLHGGNVIVDMKSQPAGRRAVFIDDQLAPGDPLFDLVSIQNWSFEVMEDAAFARFNAGLAAGHGAWPEAPAAHYSVFVFYHLIRSLGRVAYYLRVNPSWVEPHGPEQLHRHLDLLERLADAPVPFSSAVDPLTAPGRFLHVEPNHS